MRILSVAVIVAAITSVLMLTILPLSGSVRSLLPLKSYEVQEYAEVRAEFFPWALEPVLVSLSGEDVEGEVAELAAELQAIPNVNAVYFPFDKAEEHNLPFIVRSADGQLGTLLLELALVQSAAEEFTRARAIQQALQKWKQLEPQPLGASHINLLIADATKSDLLMLVPAVLIALFIALFLLFRNLSLAIALSTPAVFGLFWCMLPLIAFGIPLGYLSQLAPLIVLMLGASYGVALYVEASAHGQIGSRSSMRATLLSLVSTGLGFLALTLVGILELTQLALLSCWGFLGIALVLRFILLPQIKDLPIAGFLENPSAQRLSAITSNWKIASFVLVLLLVVGAQRGDLPIKTSPLGFLPADLKERKRIEAAYDRGVAHTDIHIVISRVDGAPLDETDMQFLQEIRSRLGKHILAGTSFGFDSVQNLDTDSLPAPMQNSGFLNPRTYLNDDQTRAHIIVDTLVHGPELQRMQFELRSLINSHLRLRASGFSVAEIEGAPARDIEYDDIPPLEIPVEGEQEKESKAEEAEYLPEKIITITSFESLLLKQLELVPKGGVIALSILCTILVIGFALILRSFWLTVIAIVPNALTIAGFYGLAGMTLDSMNLGAAIVPIVALGLAVDHTLSYIIEWKAIRPNDKKLHEAALVEHQRHSLFAQLSSSLIVVAGSLVFFISDIEPIREFGLLLAGTLAIGALADAIVLPALLRYEPFFHELLKKPDKAENVEG